MYNIITYNTESVYVPVHRLVMLVTAGAARTDYSAKDLCWCRFDGR